MTRWIQMKFGLSVKYDAIKVATLRNWVEATLFVDTESGFLVFWELNSIGFLLFILVYPLDSKFRLSTFRCELFVYILKLLIRFEEIPVKF